MVTVRFISYACLRSDAYNTWLLTSVRRGFYSDSRSYLTQCTERHLRTTPIVIAIHVITLPLQNKKAQKRISIAKFQLWYMNYYNSTFKKKRFCRQVSRENRCYNKPISVSKSIDLRDGVEVMSVKWIKLIKSIAYLIPNMQCIHKKHHLLSIEKNLQFLISSSS